jgi:hypothetical protein
MGENYPMAYSTGIEIIIMTRDRPEYLKRAVQAINNIEFGPGAQLVISNNSAKGAAIEVPKEGNWSVRNRNYPLTIHEHFGKIISEVTHEWVCITHDDDELLPHFGELFLKFFKDNQIRIISGLTEIKNSEFDPRATAGYQKRIQKSGVTKSLEYACSDFLSLQLKYGSLFPFSAIAMRTSYIKKTIEKFSFAADYFFAMMICEDNFTREANKLIYDSLNPVIKYQLHDLQDSQNLQMKYEMRILSLMCKIEIYNRNPKLFNLKSKLNLIFGSIYALRIAYLGATGETIKNFESSWRSLRNVPLQNLLLFCIFKISPRLVGLVPTWEFAQKIRWKFYTLFANYKFKKGRQYDRKI